MGVAWSVEECIFDVESSDVGDSAVVVAIDVVVLNSSFGVPVVAADAVAAVL